MKSKAQIIVETTIRAPIELVWKFWISPEAISHWNNASPNWHTPYVENNVKEGGLFLWRMEAKDGSFGFDFSGVYKVVKPSEQIQYVLGDERKVKIDFQPMGSVTKVTETFEAESENSLELQQSGWQAILDNFRKYVEENNV